MDALGEVLRSGAFKAAIHQDTGPRLKSILAMIFKTDVTTKIANYRKTFASRITCVLNAVKSEIRPSLDLFLDASTAGLLFQLMQTQRDRIKDTRTDAGTTTPVSLDSML